MKVHDYHFLITKDLVKNLNKVIELNCYSFSGKICYILSKINNISRFFDILEINEETKVENLKTKKNIHLYIEYKLFKKLKYYHGKFNSYSIALFVRMIIKLFLDMEQKYGFKGALIKIQKISKNLKKINNLKNKRLRIIQLYNFIGIKYGDLLKLEIILVKLLL